MQGGSHAYYESDINAVIWVISGFVSLEDFIVVARETNALRIKHNCNKQINNTKNMKILSKDIQLWIDDVYFPEAQKSGLKYFAFIVPQNTFGKLSMELVNNDAPEKFNMEIKYFESEDDANSWIVSK